jgi:hypothetical protein
MFVVGGTLTTEPYSEIDNENLAIIDIKKLKCFFANSSLAHLITIVKDCKLIERRNYKYFLKLVEKFHLFFACLSILELVA